MTFTLHIKDEIILPDPIKKARRSDPVDRIIRRRSALNNSNGIVCGKRNSMKNEYDVVSNGKIPKLLAASPSNVLVNAPLTILPIFVFSDLREVGKTSETESVIDKNLKDSNSEVNSLRWFYQTPKAPAAKRAAHWPQWSVGDIRGSRSCEETSTRRGETWRGGWGNCDWSVPGDLFRRRGINDKLWREGDTWCSDDAGGDSGFSDTRVNVRSAIDWKQNRWIQLGVQFIKFRFFIPRPVDQVRWII